MVLYPQQPLILFVSCMRRLPRFVPLPEYYGARRERFANPRNSVGMFFSVRVSNIQTAHTECYLRVCFSQTLRKSINEDAFWVDNISLVVYPRKQRKKHFTNTESFSKVAVMASVRKAVYRY